MTGADQLWLGVGLFGQVLFSLRFVIQWISSEREGRSVIPVAFWYLSIAGSLTLLTYALYRHDIVFSLGQGAGLLVYVRNLALLRSARPVADVTT